MEPFITTNLAYFLMNNIKPNFTKLSKEYNLDRYTLKKHYDAGEYKPRKKRKYESYYDEYLDIISTKLDI